jgi:hypothetical protein
MLANLRKIDIFTPEVPIDDVLLNHEPLPHELTAVEVQRIENWELPAYLQQWVS